MSLRNYILSDENIYLAIYAVKSYVFEPQLLSIDDTKELRKLTDPFNEDYITKVIESVREILKTIIDKKEVLFDVQVYFKPKDFNNGVYKFRPLHTASLYQLISMVALMNPLIYEVPSMDNNWKLNLSNLSRLIPNNFYGNRVSKHPEELFKKWNIQYKKYTQKANEYFKTFHESQEFKYELKLDLRDFFPSVNPLILYKILLDNSPVTLSVEDLLVFKTIIYKLTVCNVTNLMTEEEKEYYYQDKYVMSTYTKGIPQGLPQSYFFGNICMISISKILDEVFKGKSVYYVDDSYIYTNENIDRKNFIDYIKTANNKIKNCHEYLLKEIEIDDFICTVNYYNNNYGVEIHEETKSTFTDVSTTDSNEVYLKMLSREASQIGTDMLSTYSEDEDLTMLNRIDALLKVIEEQLKNTENDQNQEGFKTKLQRYYKYFEYRKIKLELQLTNKLSEKVYEIVSCDKKNIDIGKCVLPDKVDIEKFFEYYKNDIWQVAISLLISNTTDMDDHIKIKEFLKMINMYIYGEKLKNTAYLNKAFEGYLRGNEVVYNYNPYETINKRTDIKMSRYALVNNSVLKKEFVGVKIKNLSSDVLSSFGICSDDFVRMSRIVCANSNRLQRMCLNAIYSKLFKVGLSDNLILSSYDNKGISYGELRILTYLRNEYFVLEDFLNWNIDINDRENNQNIDYTIFEILGILKKYVVDPIKIDNLIRVHKYTCDIWKNGAKHLYFYTLHNQEHAVDLVKNIVKIIKIFSYFKISQYDYYLLFISCYLHDISMVRIASTNDFLLDNDTSEIIVTDFELNYGLKKGMQEVKKQLVGVYKLIDAFFENKIRSNHAIESAFEIRNREDLDFLDLSVREGVADISYAHMIDTKDIYHMKGEAANRLISYKFDKILLRIADLLDMSEHRVSKPILNHNISNMSSLSAFHWVSHLLTEKYKLRSEYVDSRSSYNKEAQNLLEPGCITEQIHLDIHVSLSQFSAIKSRKCSCRMLKDESLSNTGFTIELSNENCSSDKCNFLCKWFNDKNDYLLNEMYALEQYLNRIPAGDRFYKTKIFINVIVSNQTNLTDEQFEIIKNKIS